MVILSEVKQTEKDKYHISFMCEIYSVNLFTKQKESHRFRKQTTVTTGESGEEGIN